jgi:hypothetical protein
MISRSPCGAASAMTRSEQLDRHQARRLPGLLAAELERAVRRVLLAHDAARLQVSGLVSKVMRQGPFGCCHAGGVAAPSESA